MSPMANVTSETALPDDDLPLTANGILISLRPCFQEYTLERLDMERDAFTVIERTLARGDRRELRWLFARYGRGAWPSGCARLVGGDSPADASASGWPISTSTTTDAILWDVAYGLTEPLRALEGLVDFHNLTSRSRGFSRQGYKI